MSRLFYGGCYVVIASAILIPVGLRALTSPAARQHQLDAEMVDAGRALFEHEWEPNDPLSPQGDGLGPVFNARSCVACHHQAGVGGGGGLQANVTTFTVDPVAGQRREGVVHASATQAKYQETLWHLDSTFPAISQPTLEQVQRLERNQRRSNSMCRIEVQPRPVRRVHVSQRNTPALFGARLIDELPDHVLIAEERAQQLRWGMPPAGTEQFPVGRAVRLADGRVGHFGWKAQAASLSDFVRAACANELGLGNSGQAQPRPLGSAYSPVGLDLTDRQCDQITTFIASLPRPEEQPIEHPEQAETGKQLFMQVGCAACHTPDLGSVKGIYSDLLLHPMGTLLEGGGNYNDPVPTPLPEETPSPDGGPSPTQWRTPPLWGVADSAPYLHDGRAATLKEAIELHAGQALTSANRFKGLGSTKQAQLLAFLKTLRAPQK